MPQRWVDMVRHTLQTLGPKVLASRMLRDYVEELYAPAAQASRALAAQGFAPAREVASWRADVAARWSSVRVVHVETAGVGDVPQVGSTLTLRATVDLAGLPADAVRVQAVYGRVDEADDIHRPALRTLTAAGTGDDGLPRFEGDVPLERSGAFGYTVRVLPHHDLLPGRRRPRAGDDGLSRAPRRGRQRAAAARPRRRAPARRGARRRRSGAARARARQPRLPVAAVRRGAAALDEVRAAAARVPAFDALLVGPHAFAPDGRGRVLVHVRLADERPVRALAALLGADLRQVHLSVARVLPGGDVARCRPSWRRCCRGACGATELDVTVQRAGRWAPALRVPLGAGCGQPAGGDA